MLLGGGHGQLEELAVGVVHGGPQLHGGLQEREGDQAPGDLLLLADTGLDGDLLGRLRTEHGLLRDALTGGAEDLLQRLLQSVGPVPGTELEDVHEVVLGLLVLGRGGEQLGGCRLGHALREQDLLPVAVVEDARLLGQLVAAELDEEVVGLLLLLGLLTGDVVLHGCSFR